MKRFRGMVLLLCLLLFTGCTSSEKGSGASKVVESFYNALVLQDRDRIGSIACAEWEKTALREVDAFMGVKSKLVDFSCSTEEITEEKASVTCSGKISASYGNEITDFPLDGRTHTVVKEQGEWRLCGY